MRLSSSSEEIATASTSRSVRSANFFTAGPVLTQFRTILNRYRRLPACGQLAGWCVGRLQERQQQPTHFRRLLLLHPVAGAIDQMAADHVAAGGLLHGLEHAGTLIGAPVLLAGD